VRISGELQAPGKYRLTEKMRVKEHAYQERISSPLKKWF